MIPIVVFLTEYTTTRERQVLKFVPCEHCATEYVYVMKREAVGSGTSVQFLNDEGAQQNALTGSEETLRSYLENDFDPVPCPVCGHYQRYMFPKLYPGSSAWISLTRLAMFAAVGLSLIGVLYWVVASVRQPGERAFVRLSVALALLTTFGLIVFALGAVERAQARRFDPNTEGQQARIAKGRSRAITRAEFEAIPRPEDGTGTPHEAGPV